MADEKHLLLTINGYNAGTALQGETWQCGIRFLLDFGLSEPAPIGTLPDDWNPTAVTINRDETDWTITGNWYADGPLTASFQADDWLNDQVAPAMYDWMVGTKQSSNCRITSLNVYPIGAPSGRSLPAPPYSSGSPVTLTWKTPYGAGTTSGVLPLQCSIVASHRSAQVGRRGRGRIYLPPTGSAVITDGVLSGTNPQTVANAHAAMLEAVCDIPATPRLRPIVTGKPWSSYAVIQSVEVGNVIDTQQRRRRSLVETRASSSVSY